jgi:hypothetical protein
MPVRSIIIMLMVVLQKDGEAEMDGPGRRSPEKVTRHPLPTAFVALGEILTDEGASVESAN